MTDLVRFVPICGFKSSTFYNFYYYPIEDINGQMDVIETMKKQKGKLMKAKGVVINLATHISISFFIAEIL